MPDTLTLGPELSGTWVTLPASNGKPAIARFESLVDDNRWSLTSAGKPVMSASFSTAAGETFIEPVPSAEIDGSLATASELNQFAKRSLWLLLNPLPAIRAGGIGAIIGVVLAGVLYLVVFHESQVGLAGVSADLFAKAGTVGFSFVTAAAAIGACCGALANLCSVLAGSLVLAHASRKAVKAGQTV